MPAPVCRYAFGFFKMIERIAMQLSCDPSNPKSPVRYRETELLAYIERLQVATNEQRIGNQVPGTAK